LPASAEIAQSPHWSSQRTLPHHFSASFRPPTNHSHFLDSEEKRQKARSQKPLQLFAQFAEKLCIKD
jgi:hypothetical protein